MDLEEAAHEYHANRTSRARDLLAQRCMGAAKAKALRMTSSRGIYGSQVEDYIGYAMVGLVKAIDSWTPEGGLFQPWLMLKVQSAVLDGMRRTDHLARSHRTELKASGENGAERWAKPLALDKPILAGDDVTLLAILSDTESDLRAELRLEEIDMVNTLLPVLNDLRKYRPKEYEVLLTFFTHESLMSKAIEHGVTESRISQIRKEAVSLVRDGLEGKMIKPPAPRGQRKQCAAEGCRKGRESPTGRRGRPSVYCSEECRQKTIREMAKRREEVKRGTHAPSEEGGSGP